LGKKREGLANQGSSFRKVVENKPKSGEEGQTNSRKEKKKNINQEADQKEAMNSH